MELPEHLDHLFGGGLMDDQLTGVEPLVEPPEGDGEVAQLLERDRAPLLPGGAAGNAARDRLDGPDEPIALGRVEQVLGGDPPIDELRRGRLG